MLLVVGSWMHSCTSFIDNCSALMVVQQVMGPGLDCQGFINAVVPAFGFLLRDGTRCVLCH